jgi:hypothetical protein
VWKRRLKRLERRFGELDDLEIMAKRLNTAQKIANVQPFYPQSSSKTGWKTAKYCLITSIRLFPQRANKVASSSKSDKNRPRINADKTILEITL